MDFSSRYQGEFVLPLVEGSVQDRHFCTHTPKYISKALLLASLNALTLPHWKWKIQSLQG